MKQESRFIAVEGNIGTGKSTVLPLLAEALGFKVLQEPVDDPEFLRLLKEFTSNPTETAPRLRFQKYITETRSTLLKDLPVGDYVIERSLFSDLIFSQVNMLSMERPDGEYLSYYYDIIDRLTDYPRMTAIVYLDCDPELSYARMSTRARDAEDGTPLDYLVDLRNYHNACLPQICRQYDTPLVTHYISRVHSPNDIAAMLANRLDELVHGKI